MYIPVQTMITSKRFIYVYKQRERLNKFLFWPVLSVCATEMQVEKYDTESMLDDYLFGSEDPLADIVCAWVQSDEPYQNNNTFATTDLVDTQISDAEHARLDNELIKKYRQVSPR